jgi:uncharacterized membrane protein YozB (DUF420 family)
MLTHDAGAPSAPESTLSVRSKSVSSAQWWRRPWILPVAVIALAFVTLFVPRYLTGDPSQSRVPGVPGFPLHYAVLVGHVVFGSIAMLTCVAQIWPWVRKHHPKVHRMTGRVYVFAGVLPAGVLGLTDGAVSPFGPATALSDVMLALLWLGCTGAGWVAAWQRRFGDHRRWMIRSFALTMSIILNRVIGIAAAMLLAPQLSTTFGGNELAFKMTIAAISAWLGWTVPLLAAQLWIDRKPRRSAGKPRDVAAATR